MSTKTIPEDDVPDDITDIPTSETNDTYVLSPDGSGGVEWRVESTPPSATTPSALIYAYNAFR